ncbi:tetratricopeptide repeat protein [Bernardetia sp. OM2101]|uniref:tetratricopeptide repeat protein n=1 Tax=Bernardetia sp. OM2101 TaxID=3344876 RepID=UPI0035CF0673
MKFILLFFIFLYLSIFSLFAQVDSLKLILENDYIQDTTKIDVWNQLSEKLQYTDVAQAMVYGKNALQLAKKIENTRRIMLCNNSLGIMYAIQGDYQEALQYLLNAEQLAYQLQEYDNLAHIYSNIAGIYAREQEYSKALSVAEKALKIDIKQNNISNITTSYGNISRLYKYLKDYSKALEFQDKYLEMLKQNNQFTPKTLCYAFQNIGDIYRLQGKYDESLEWFEKAKKNCQETDNVINVTIIGLNQTQVYVEQKEYEKAITNASKILDSLEKHPSLLELEMAYQVLAQAHEESGNEKKAIFYHKKYAQTRDSLFNQEKEKTIQEMQVRFQTKLKEQDIQNLTEENNYQKQLTFRAYWAITGLIAAILLLIALGISYNKRNKLKEKLAKNEIELLEQQKQKGITEQAKLKAEQKLLEQEQKRILVELDHKQRELSSTTMYIYQKNELLENLKNKLEKLESQLQTEAKKEVKSIRKSLQSSQNMDEDWDRFKLHFDEVHPNFFSWIAKKYSSLTQNDSKLCAYIKMGLSNKEIASLLNVNPRSIQVAKYRLKKKMNLETEDDLTKIIQEIA